MSFPRALIAVSALSLAASLAVGEEFLPPPDVGIADIQRDYGAKGDGTTDDTLAFQNALTDNKRLIYIPDGTYLVSDTLRWGFRQTRQVFQGQNRDKTVIKLKDNAAGYQNPMETRAVIWTGEAPAQRFQNGIRNLTVDTGKGNPGAIGIQYIANNQGGMHHVTIRSGDNLGRIGLDLGYSNEQGPCLINDIHVVGFAVGISTKHAVDSVVLENILVEGQREYGFVNDGQCISLRNFTSRNAVTGYYNVRGASLTVLVDAKFEGGEGASDVPAILNESYLLARDIETSGYAMAIENRFIPAESLKDAVVDEFVSHRPISLFPSIPATMRLPIKETPEVPFDPPSEWISATAFGPETVNRIDRKGNPDPHDDYTASLQQAIDSGKTTVFFPMDSTTVWGTVYVRGNVRRIIGLRNQLARADEKAEPSTETIAAARAAKKERGEPTREEKIKEQLAMHLDRDSKSSDLHPTFVIEDGAHPVVVIERFDCQYAELDIIQKSKRTLVVSSMAARLETEAGSGDVFLEDVVSNSIRIHGSDVWARQLNTEGWREPKTLNDGGNLWILGLKTEGDTTQVVTSGGGRTEILGGFIYANKDWMPGKIMFANDDSSLTASVGEWVIRKAPFDPVRETRGGVERLLTADEALPRGGGAALPLYTGFVREASAAPAKPGDPAAENVGTSEIELAWTDASDNEDGFAIEVADGGGEFRLHHNVAADATSAVVDGLKADSAYRLRVSAFNGAGVAAADEVAAKTVAASPVGSGTGLQATYFKSRSLTEPVATRVDAGVDFDWSAAEPPDGAKADAFSVRWTGEIQPRFSEEFTFTAGAGATRMWVGDQLLWDAWNGERHLATSGTIRLEAGKKYPVRLEAWVDGKGVSHQLKWSGTNQAEEVIPASQLVPAAPTQSEVSAAFEALGAAGDLQITEGAGRSATLVFTRTAPLDDALTVDFALDGSAAVGADFQPVPTRLEFAAGEATASVAVEPINDDHAEPTEFLRAELAPSIDSLAVGPRPRLNILDDDVPPAGAGTGLQARYFAKRGFEGPVAERTDGTVSFNWNKKPPVDGITLENTDGKRGKKTVGYSVRWTGKIQPRFSGRYTMILDSSIYGGARLTIDGKVIVDAWDEKAGTHGLPPVGEVDFEAGKPFDIVVEYEHRNTYGAYVDLQWRSDQQFLETVPASQLFPGGGESTKD